MGIDPSLLLLWEDILLRLTPTVVAKAVNNSLYCLRTDTFTTIKIVLYCRMIQTSFHPASSDVGFESYVPFVCCLSCLTKYLKQIKVQQS